MVFGDNCVLAELRAHYPEHRHNRRQRQDKTRQDKTTRPHATRRRHSTITQHYHKDTTLNQQRRDSKHTERQSDAKGAAQHKVPDPPQTRGITARPPRHSTQPPSEQQGETPTRRRGHQRQTGGSPSHSRPSITQPPHPATPPHHPQCPHPPPRRGGGAQRIPHHTKTTDRHTPPHTTHPAENSTRHNRSTHQHCSGMSRARGTPQTEMNQ